MTSTIGTLMGASLRNFLLGARVPPQASHTSKYAFARVGGIQNEAGIGKPLYNYDPTKWLYIGWENDHPKSWTYMGGGLGPGQQAAIQYALILGEKTYCPEELAPDRRAKIHWYLRDGYLPCPVSEWLGGPIRVQIQHFANRILEGSLTAVYSRVCLTNISGAREQVRLNINAGPIVEVPLSHNPTGSTSASMFYEILLDAGDTANRDFIAVASGDLTNILKLNKVVNPGFESDSRPTGTPRGWATTGDADASYITGWNSPGYPESDYTQVQVQRSGRFQLVHHRGTPYKVYTYQTVSSLPDGIYDFRAWVRSAGGQGVSCMVAKGYGGPDLLVKIGGSDYRMAIIPDIHVTTGRCEIGFFSQGDADYFTLVDDVAFYDSEEFRTKSTKALKSAGSFDDNYSQMATHYKQRIAALTHPVTLPTSGLVDMYKSIQILLWESMVKSGDDYEIRAGAKTPTPCVYSYDRTFSHDVPNFADEFMREGDYEIAKRILRSSYYKALNTTSWLPNYLDTIGKYILPYAEYMRATGDLDFFTPALREELKTAARNIHRCRVFNDKAHYGLMKKSQDFENWEEDYLLCDNWAALHGLQAYKYLCDKWGDESEAEWAAHEMKDLNDCLNNALDRSCTRRKTNYYLAAFDDSTLMCYGNSVYSWVPYSGALSSFPWGAWLKGFDLGGAWKDKFNASIRYALKGREERGVPPGSWGAWWGQVTYGSTYNASAGVECLFSERYRSEAIKNLEFLLQNQCAPFQWSEAFENKGTGQWVGMYTPQMSYGNYEAWGPNFSKQALLQACVSVKTDGTVIIGRGLPNHWLRRGAAIEWANVNVNDHRKINFRIISDGAQVTLHIWGDTPIGNVLFNLPAFKNNVLSASAGTVDNEKGVVELTPQTTFVTVKFRKAMEGSASLAILEQPETA